MRRLLLRLLVLLLVISCGAPAWAIQWGTGTGTSYPTTIDTVNTRSNVGGGTCSSAVATNICAEWLNDWQGAVTAIQTELGTLPKGAYGSVKARLDAISGSAITQLTGDVTAVGPGSVAATLANSGVSSGSYTLSNITVDAKGRLTAASSTSTTGSGNVCLATGPSLDSPIIATKINLPRVTAFPGSPSTGDTVIVTDDSAVGVCDSAAGSAQSLCQYNGSAWVSLGDGGSGGGAPTGASYWTATSESGLSAEVNLGALTTGLILNTVSAGVGTPSAYGGASCTNQFVRSLSASGAATCSTVGASDLASTAVTPGSYTNTNLTVDAQGRITAASNGSAGGNVAWNSITNPTGNAALTMAAYTTTLTYNATTGAGTNLFELKDTTSNTGTGALLFLNTASGSAALPFKATAGGTANGVQVGTTGALAKIGTGSVQADNLVFGSDATGDLPLRGASVYGRLGKGTQYQSLQATATTAAYDAVHLDQSAAVTGTLPVTNGGTGAATLTGVLKGNGTSAFTAATAGTDYVSPSSTEILTNKTLSAEGTGNVLTVPFTWWLPAAGCNNATAGTIWDLPTSTPAVAACVTGTNTQKGVLQYADTSGGFSAQITQYLPVDWTTGSTVDVDLIWTTSATTGNAKWTVQFICGDVAASMTDDAAFPASGNGFNTVTTAAPGTANRLQVSTITGATLPTSGSGSCTTATRELLHIRVFRDGNDAADTIAATANLVGMNLTYRRAM